MTDATTPVAASRMATVLQERLPDAGPSAPAGPRTIRMRRSALVVMLGLLVASLPVAGLSADTGFAHECAPPPQEGGSISVIVGQITCQRMHSEMVGGVTAFGYYVPPGCAQGDCPVLYLLHGTGGSYRTLIGTPQNPNIYLRALTAGPPVDTAADPEPWRYADPTTWVPKPPLDFVVITPHNKTVPGGHGLEPGIDGLWSDWNPRYAEGGDQERYPTPPPRFASHVANELVPFVDAHLPVGVGREYRAIHGRSQGGFGALKVGLEFPDVFASVGAVSGGSIPVGHVAMLPDAPVGVTGVPGVPYVPLPGLVPKIGGEDTGEPATSAIVAGMPLAWGDPAADTAHWRSGQPATYATNGRATAASGDQSQHLRLIVMDAVPRRVEDVLSDRYHYDQFYETAALLFTVEMVRALDAAEVGYGFELNPGVHSSVYSNPHLRRFLESHYDNVRRADGSGDPPTEPQIFDYRTIRRDFRVWGWSFSVQREAAEFLNLRRVSCERLTLQGTGTVTVSVPARCGTGLDGERTFTTDLGPPMPIDEPSGGTQVPGYGATLTLELQPLRTCPGRNPHCRSTG